MNRQENDRTPELTAAQYAEATGNGMTGEQAARQLRIAELETRYRKQLGYLRASPLLQLEGAFQSYLRSGKRPVITSRRAASLFEKYAKPYADALREQQGGE